MFNNKAGFKISNPSSTKYSKNEKIQISNHLHDFEQAINLNFAEAAFHENKSLRGFLIIIHA